MRIARECLSTAVLPRTQEMKILLEGKLSVFGKDRVILIMSQRCDYDILQLLATLILHDTN